MVTILLCSLLVAALGALAMRSVYASNANAIEKCPSGNAPPGHALTGFANVHGGLYDRGGNTPQDRFDHHNYYAHRVGGDCDTSGSSVGGGPMQCGGDCSKQSPNAQWKKVAVIPAATQLQPGNEVNVNTRGVQPFDTMGRHAHVVGIRLKGTHRFTLGATNALFSGFQQMQVWSQIVLEDVSGWSYVAGLDGRDVMNDRWLRSFSQQAVLSQDSVPADIGVNAGAGDVDHVVDLYFPLVRPYAHGPAAMEGSIPLAAIQAEGDSAFRFTAPSALTGSTGITPNGFVGNVEVWFKLVYLPVKFLDQPWQIENYVEKDLASNARRCDRMTEYLVVCPRPEDDGGLSLNDFGIATFTVGKETIASGLTLAQQNQRTRYQIADDPRFQDATPTLIGPSNDGSLRMIFVTGPTPRARSGMASGVVGFEWTSRTRTFTRFLQRTIACHQGNRVADHTAGKKDVQSITPDGQYVAPDKQLPLVIK